MIIFHTCYTFLPKWANTIRFCSKRTIHSSTIIRCKYKTMQDIQKVILKQLLGENKEAFMGEMEPRDHLMKYMPKKQEDLPIRTMKDSFDMAIVPISSDMVLQSKYSTNLGQIRLGRLLEDMDIFAAYAAWKHVWYPNMPENAGFPVLIVTVAVSQIDFLQQVKPGVDVRLSGNVCWVGQTSLEVIVWLHQFISGKWVEITRALFLMAARNPMNTGSAFVNLIKAETEEDKELLKGGEDRKRQRQALMKESLLTTIPTVEEIKKVHSLFTLTIDPRVSMLEKRVLPPNSKWMHEAEMTDLVFCHPEFRNVHNKIFGGFLMRKALELSWLISYIHGKTLPKLCHISDIGFYFPVELGSFLKMSGSISYTNDTFVQVFVSAQNFHKSLEGKNTTVFNFTYDLGKPVTQVFPNTYLETIKYLDARRRFKTINPHPRTEKN